MAGRQSGLGKGLDSLIPKQSAASGETSENETGNPQEIKVKLTQIKANESQPRREFDEDSLMELADSIRQFGVIQPLIVQKKGDFYELIAGERRWRAAKLAGLREVPVIIKKFSKQQAMEISLIENIQRENLNPIEEASAYQRLLTEFQLKQEEVAARVSKSRTSITNSLRLLKLDARVQQMLIDGKLATGHARALLGIADGDAQYRAAQRIYNEKMSVREAERFVKSLTKPRAKREASSLANTLVYQDLADKMKTLLGTKVTIEPKKKGQGKIVIDYYSGEDLERLLDLFRSIPNPS